MKPRSTTVIDKTVRWQVQCVEPQRRPQFSLAIISVTVQLLKYVFWVISVYFNIRNALPKSGTFLLGHPVYSRSVTRRFLWSKQKRTWRRSLVRPPVCDVVQETKQFVDCHQSRHWRILQNRLRFEFRENLLDSSTLSILVHCSARDHMDWPIWVH
jgi:hypothetical protein